MGLLTDIISERHQKRADETANKTAAYKLAIEAGHQPTATEDQRKTADWAWQQMLGETDMPKQAHPMVINLFKKILGGFTGGDKEIPQTHDPVAPAPLGSEGPMQPPAKPRITAPIEQQMSVANQLSQNDIGQAVQKEQALTPAVVDRARQTAGVQAEFQPPPTKELGDGTIVQWDREQKQWVPAISQGQPMQGAHKPPSILNGKDGQPIGIQRPTGQLITDPSSMLPDERAVFEAAQGAFKEDLARDEKKTLGQEDRFNRSQEGISNRFAQTLAAQNAKTGQQTDYRTQVRIDDARKQYNSNPIVQRFGKAAEGLQFIQSMDPNSKNPADDQGLIYAFAKAMDPDSAVREGEYATIQKYAQSWLSSFGFNAKRVLENTEFLTPQARQNMKTTIESKVKSMHAPYKVARQDAIHRLGTLGVVGNDYIPDYTEGIKGLEGLTRPKPPNTGAALDANTAKKYLDLAGGDKDAARKMAAEDGWKL